MSRFLVALSIVMVAFVSLITLPARAQNLQDINVHRECTECGMDRKAYGFSRMLIIFTDGKEVGVCSLHCATMVIDNVKGETVKNLLVADRNTHELIPAEKAIWVLGGKKRGVMTMRAKWAFTQKGAAEDFIKEYGGEIVNWDDALVAARSDAMPQGR